MLFNSIQFFLFIVPVFILYWMVNQLGVKWRNTFIIAASYFFYGCWDWKFLGLLFLSSTVDFSIGYLMGKSNEASQRKRLLYVSLLFNLGLLGFFKYFNFFAESFVQFSNILGYHPSFVTLNIILPVGISFYTFQSLSYTIEVYRNNLKPSQSIIDFMAFVSFFPQLVAGPIERATSLLPQFYKQVSFDYDKAKEGCRLILWGFFKKIVIADACGEMVNQIFAGYSNLPAIDLLLGAIYFSFQIYGDFSGYSDIAIGTSKLLGFDLMRNFNFPYFSRDISEFWRRWHISLSTWFRDYLYLPLGGNRVSKPKQIRNVFAVFLISGFWHGANWTFIFWGLIHSLLYLPLLLLNKTKTHLDIVAKGRMFPTFKELIQIVTTFLLTTFAWVFFRSKSITQSFDYIHSIFKSSIFSKPHYFHYVIIFSLVVFTILEWYSREGSHPFQMKRFPKYVRWTVYSLTICIILFNFEFHKPSEFIYFQF